MSPFAAPLLLWALQFICYTARTHALYSESDPVVVLTASNFASEVLKPNVVALVEFYAPWCGHCKQMAPIFKKVAANLQGIAVVGAIDCDDKAHSQLCSEHGVRGFPTLKLFGANVTTNPYTGSLYKESSDYKGARTARAMVDAVTALLTDTNIVRAKDKAGLEEVVKQAGNVPLSILATNKQEPTNLYKSLSMLFAGRLTFVEVHQSAEDLVADLKVEDFPTLIVLKAGGERVAYSGELKAEPLREFLEAHAAPAKASSGAAPEAGGQGQVPPVTISHLSVDNVTGRIDAEEGLWLIAFYSAQGDECKDSIAEWESLATELQEVAKLGQVNLYGDNAKAVEPYGVKLDKLKSEPCKPQLLLLTYEADKLENNEFDMYNGPWDAKELALFVADRSPDMTHEVTSNSFDSFLAINAVKDANGVPMRVTPKVVLFTKKSELPAAYKALALNFFKNTKLAFGWVKYQEPANHMLVQQMGVRKAPSMLLVMATGQIQAEQGAETGRLPLGVQPYMGPLKYQAMAAWVDQMARLTGVHNDAPLPDLSSVLPEVSTAAGLSEHCLSRKGLCALALLDARAAEHRDTLDRLAAVAAKQAQASGGGLWGFSWVDGWRQQQLLGSFNLSPRDMPAVLAYSPAKERYAVLYGPFGASDVDSFLNDVVSGKKGTLPVSSAPRVVDGGSDPGSDAAAAAAGGAGVGGEGDGAAEEVEPVEEEFDLSEVLSEEVEEKLASKEELLEQAELELKKAEQAKQNAAKKSKKAKKAKKPKRPRGQDEL